MFFNTLYTLNREQRIKGKSLTEVWDFFSSPLNLREITPEWLNFQVITKDIHKMYEGMIIEYRVSPIVGFQIPWVTEITKVDQPSYFIDEQRAGPYKMWHHQHFFREHKDGVMMQDTVSYILPYGFFGKLTSSYVKNRLNEIFDYRAATIDKIFD